MVRSQAIAVLAAATAAAIAGLPAAANAAPNEVAKPVHIYTVTSTADTGSGSLRAELVQTNADGTYDEIKIPAGIYSVSTDELLAEDPAGLDIVGAGADKVTIARTGTGRTLEVLDDTPLSLSGVTLTGGSATNSGGEDGNGGAIELFSGLLRISASVIEGATATGNGGAITTVSGNNFGQARLELDNVQLLHDQADGDGGAIYSSGQITASHVLAHLDSADLDGGAIEARGHLDADHLTLTGDTAAAGGGLYLAGSATVVDSQIGGTTAADADVASQLGGGVEIDNGQLTMTGGTIAGNSVTGAASTGGGVDLVGGQATLHGVTVTGNIAAGAGGGLNVAAADLDVANSTLTDNNAGAGGTSWGGTGGAIDVDGGDLSIEQSTLSHNQAKAGGAIAAQEASNLTATKDVLTDNDTSNSQPNITGGAVYVDNSESRLVDSQLTGNDGYSGGAVGGNQADIALTRSTFSKNVASSSGGAVGTESTDLSIVGGSMTGNSSSTGGAIDAEGDQATVEQATISGNHANALGGGINLSGGQITVTDSTLAHNTISGDPQAATTVGGGAVSVDEGTLNLNNTTVAANSVGVASVPQHGGGIFLNDFSTGNLADDTLVGNTIAAGPTATGLQLAVIGNSGASLSDSLLGGAAACDFATGVLQSEGGNVGTDTSCALSTATDTISSRLALGTLGLHGGALETVPLLAGSAAIGATTDCTVEGTDERGEPRPTTSCDSGAYQFAPASVAKLSASHAKPGAKLTIDGSGFLFTTKVTIGAKTAHFTVVSDGVLKVVVPSLPKRDRHHVVPVVVASRDGAGRHGSLHVV
jgi:hypothetical protein